MKDKLEWKKEKPTVQGTYFRTTGWGRMVQQVINFAPRGGMGDWRLIISLAGKTQDLARADPENTWWWFGPIPLPPTDYYRGQRSDA